MVIDMFRKVLFATDFTPSATNALRYVIKLKEAGTEEVVVIHVVENVTLEAMVESCIWSKEDVKKCEEEIEEKVIAQAKKKMQGIKEELEKHGLKVKTVVKIGKPAINIVDTAKKEGVSIIVLGSHGKSRTEEVLIGSVAENVVRHASHIPVLLVRE